MGLVLGEIWEFRCVNMFEPVLKRLSWAGIRVQHKTQEQVVQCQVLGF